MTRTQTSMAPLRILLILALTSTSMFGCIAPIKLEFSTDFPAPVLSAVGTPPVSDGRLRFREIFCQLLAEEPDYQDASIACGNFLLRLNDELLPDAAPEPVTTPAPAARYRVLVVPGLLNECFADIALPFEDAINSLEKNGFKIEELVVGGRSSSESNALFIAETIEPLNDGQLLYFDQIIPGASLLGYVNADHWTVAVPVEEHFSNRDPSLMAQNRHLRGLLFEAMILYITESLSSPQ